jgi:hypothetical protein
VDAYRRDLLREVEGLLQVSKKSTCSWPSKWIKIFPLERKRGTAGAHKESEYEGAVSTATVHFA